MTARRWFRERCRGWSSCGHRGWRRSRRRSGSRPGDRRTRRRIPYPDRSARGPTNRRHHGRAARARWPRTGRGRRSRTAPPRRQCLVRPLSARQRAIVRRQHGLARAWQRSHLDHQIGVDRPENDDHRVSIRIRMPVKEYGSRSFRATTDCRFLYIFARTTGTVALGGRGPAMKRKNAFVNISPQ